MAQTVTLEEMIKIGTKKSAYMRLDEIKTNLYILDNVVEFDEDSKKAFKELMEGLEFFQNLIGKDISYIFDQDNLEPEDAFNQIKKEIDNFYEENPN